MTIHPFAWMRVDIHKKLIISILAAGLASCASDNSAEEPITADDIHAIESDEPAPESWTSTETTIDETDISDTEVSNTETTDVDEPEEIMTSFADETPVTNDDWTKAPADRMDQAEQTKTQAPVVEKHSESFLASMTDEDEIDASFQPDLNGVYFVKAGDSISKIAGKIYGSMNRWREVAEVNGIGSPYVIRPGDPIRFNADTAASQAFVERFDGLERGTVTVKKGDSLSKIAKRIYGKSHYWKVLLTLNEGRIESANKIFVGAKLTYVKPQALKSFASTTPQTGGDGVKAFARTE